MMTVDILKISLVQATYETETQSKHKQTTIMAINPNLIVSS